MQAQANSHRDQPGSDHSPALAHAEVSAAALLETLAGHAGKTLVFHYEGRDVLPGYHITEVKAAAFEALDCGANLESWHEAFIQLWDVPAQNGQTFMPVGKFLAIIRKVTDQVRLDPHARLSFEVSDGVDPIKLYRASSVEIGGRSVRVELARRPASCKPRDRWLDEHESSAAHACGANPPAGSRCCNDS